MTSPSSVFDEVVKDLESIKAAEPYYWNMLLQSEAQHQKEKERQELILALRELPIHIYETCLSFGRLGTAATEASEAIHSLARRHFKEWELAHWVDTSYSAPVVRRRGVDGRWKTIHIEFAGP